MKNLEIKFIELVGKPYVRVYQAQTEDAAVEFAERWRGSAIGKKVIIY